MAINKAFDWKSIDRETFKEKWRGKKKFILKSACFKMNKAVLKSGFELRKYFKGLIELNQEKEYEYLSGNGYFKFGGCFFLFDQPAEFLIKFILTPTKKLGIQIINNEMQNHDEILVYVINTLEFLLS